MTCNGKEELMPYFTVNKNAQPSTGDHEIHDLASKRGCLPSVENRTDLGEFTSCSDAVDAAKSHYPKVNGCFWCAITCHTT